MKKLIVRLCIYGLLMLLSLELLVRAFHLTKDYPLRIVDAQEVEKWQPHQTGYSVTGNRRQNFSEFHINSAGFNSSRDYKPSKTHFEIALVGDSFIEGFHQPYYNSIGKKIEAHFNNIPVYEYGYAGYDFADEVHLVDAYKDTFEAIDCVILNLTFKDDLERDTYSVLTDRMRFETPFYRRLRQFKLLNYAKNIGALNPIKALPGKLINTVKGRFKSDKQAPQKAVSSVDSLAIYQKRLDNFIALTTTYNYNKAKYILLLDASKTPDVFLNYLHTHNYKYIDYSQLLAQSKTKTNLVYDMHWNDHGRTLVAKAIADYLKTHGIVKTP